MQRTIVLVLVIAIAACGKSGATSHDQAATEVEKAPAPAATKVEPAPALPYSVIVTPLAAFAAGAPTKLQLELRDPQGKRVSELDVVHEKVMHLIVVSADLGFFTHEHPEHRADGLLDHTLTLPSAGDYTVFADFAPTGGKGAVASTTISVPGVAPPASPLVPDTLPAHATLGAFTVDFAPKALVAGQNTILAFEIRDRAGPISDLRNYLGARGHCVIVSADRKQYLHSHPLDGTDSTVQFHTVFPGPGTYKIWVEFRPRGEPLRVSYTVRVAAASSPASPMPDMDHDHMHM